MILSREEFILLHQKSLGKRMSVRCFYCNELVEGRDAKVVSTKPSDVWEKWLVCRECYMPIEEEMSKNYYE
ncbi:MAG: hypothetical protein EB127_18145 [Alphaproteobacteria bacterium]|nr:hypothetical protein [Alphaproteobacteria bacterium]